MKRNTILLVLLGAAGAARAEDPAWWTTRGVKTGAPAENLAVATVGQAKWMARQALAELESKLPEYEYAALTDDLAQIVDLSPPETGEDFAAQKAPLLVGQLKALAKPFYDHLRPFDPLWLDFQMQQAGTKVPVPGTDPVEYNPYPWNENGPAQANLAPAAIGQLKAVFAIHFEDWGGFYGRDPQLREQRWDPAAGNWVVEWTGVAGRTYFIQYTTDLVNWKYAKVIDFGPGPKSHPIPTGGAPMFFSRLICVDHPDVTSLQEAYDADFDIDSFNNLYEVMNNRDPLGPDPAGSGDTDADGVSDMVEQSRGTDPIREDNPAVGLSVLAVPAT